MTAAEFNKLTLEKKGIVLTDNSTFLDERVVYNKYKILMYSLSNFYVEVYYNVKENKIESIDALETLEDWESFLGSIHLDLLN